MVVAQALVSVKKCTNVLIYDIGTFFYRDKCLWVVAIDAYQHSSRELEFRSVRGVLDTTLCDKVGQ
jgi:hypothetical protein